MGKTTDVAQHVEDPQFADLIARQADGAITDPEAISRAIVENIGRAQSVEELLVRQSTTSAEDLVGVPLEIKETRWMKSAFDEGMGVFVVCDAVDLTTGNLITWTSGSANIMAKLYKADLEKWTLPPVTVYKADRATANGYYPMDLVAA